MGARSSGLFRLLASAVAACFVAGCATTTKASAVHGWVAPGFEEVRDELARNLEERGERGAAVAVYVEGEKVVDLWGGERNPRHQPWEENTLVPVYSTTKGVTALVVAVAHSRGWLDYDAPVARYWPEFAANGKGAITVRQLLSHQAGLVLLDEPIDYETVRDLDALAVVLARQRPSWEPGTRHGYHLSTLGFYMNELFRRVEPRHRSVGRFLEEEIDPALGLDLHIGLPASIGRDRVATIETTSPLGGLAHLWDPPAPVLFRLLSPVSTMTRTFAIPSGYDVNDPAWWRVEMPSGNGLSDARSIARLYACFASGGAELGLRAETLRALEAPARLPPAGAEDAVMGVDSYFGLGVLKPEPGASWGTNERAYGMPGAGGSFGFADPERRVGFAYVMNRMGYHMNDDPREAALRAATYRALDARATARR